MTMLLHLVEQTLGRQLKENETITTFKNEYGEWSFEVDTWENDTVIKSEEGVF